MTHTMTKTDHDIHAAVIQELAWDTQVDETEVGVEVNNGVALTGTVSNYAKKMAAQDAAHRVAGVLDVANDIQVKMPYDMGRTDTEIAQAARLALEWDVLVDDAKIRSTVTNGWITLEGTVPSLAGRSHAEWALRNLAGVRGISNNLTVSAPKVAMGTVRHAIEAALKRRAERETERIQVDVKDGAVSLSGQVHNWHEKQAILGAAGHAPGVQRIEDHLRIQPFF